MILISKHGHILSVVRTFITINSNNCNKIICKTPFAIESSYFQAQDLTFRKIILFTVARQLPNFTAFIALEILSLYFYSKVISFKKQA